MLQQYLQWSTRAHGIDPDSKDVVHRWTPLWYAVARNYLEIVGRLLERQAVDPDSKSRCGRTLLSLAVEMGHAMLTELLLKTGRVDPNSKDLEYGWIVLVWAAAS